MSRNANDTSAAAVPAQSKRSRLLGLARATRDSVTQIASGVSARAFTVDMYDEQGNLKIPQDASIYLFPDSAHSNDDGTYKVKVGGWLSCPGLMTRKNRVIMSLVKHVIRYDSSVAKERLESSQLNQNVMNENSTSDSESSYSDLASLSSERPLSGQTARPTSSFGDSKDALLKDRLSSFIARYIANAEVTIIIGSEDPKKTKDLVEKTVYTDANGFFSESIVVDYKPSVIQVTAARDQTICSFQDVSLTPNDGFGLISDIDDTVKITGVTGDKRQLLSNLFLGEVSTWSIPSVVKWYNDLLGSHNLTFHYVSNSPWQLFPLVLEYFKAVSLPWGSFQLKQYSGNLIASIMEPSSSRKRSSLHSIMNNYPHKKFVCVGDSGEHDFDSYVDLVKNYPDKILGVFIRYVPGSLSDLDDMKIFKEVNRILRSRSKVPKESKNPSENESSSSTTTEVENLIDLSDTPVEAAQKREARLPPMVPKKPTALKGNSLERPPPLPKRAVHRAHTDSDLIKPPQPPRPPPARLTVRPGSLKVDHPSRVTTSASTISAPEHRSPRRNRLDRPPTGGSFENDDVMNNLQNVYYSHLFEELTEMDPKGAEWIQRVISALPDLQESDVEFCFFSDADEDLYEKTIKLIEKKSPV